MYNSPAILRRCAAADKWQFYRPWDLLPDEEDLVERQLRDAQAQIDEELVEWEDAKRKSMGTTEDTSSTDLSLSLTRSSALTKHR